MILIEHKGERAEVEAETLLGPFEGQTEDDNAHVRWYDLFLCRCHGDIVKKAVHVTLKRGVDASALMGGFDG